MPINWKSRIFSFDFLSAKGSKMLETESADTDLDCEPFQQIFIKHKVIFRVVL